MVPDRLKKILFTASTSFLFVITAYADPSGIDPEPLNIRTSNNLYVNHPATPYPLYTAQATSKNMGSGKVDQSKGSDRTQDKYDSTIKQEGPFFKEDKNAEKKLKQVHDCLVLTPSQALKNSISRIEREKDHSVDIVSCLTVILTDNPIFLQSQNISEAFKKSPFTAILRSDTENQFLVVGSSGSVKVMTDDFDLSNNPIKEGIELLETTSLHRPAFMVIDPKAIESGKIGGYIASTISKIFNNLPDFDEDEGRIIFNTPFPHYLYGEEDTVSWKNYFGHYGTFGHGQLKDLAVWNSGKYVPGNLGTENKPKYFIKTTNSAPIELSQADMDKIASFQTSTVQGVSSILLVLNSGIRIAFSGISTINQEFLKSEDEIWRRVIGLSSSNGFTVTVEDPKGENSLQPPDVKEWSSLPSGWNALPEGIIEIIRMGVPGLGSLGECLTETDLQVRIAAISSIAEFRGDKVMELLSSAAR